MRRTGFTGGSTLLSWWAHRPDGVTPIGVALPGRSARRSAPPDDLELVARVDDALLQLPAVGRRLAALDPLELPFCRLQLLPGARVVDLVGQHGVVHERDRAVLLHLEEPGAGREGADLRTGHVDPCLPRLQRRD